MTLFHDRVSGRFQPPSARRPESHLRSPRVRGVSQARGTMFTLPMRAPDYPPQPFTCLTRFLIAHATLAPLYTFSVHSNCDFIPHAVSALNLASSECRFASRFESKKPPPCCLRAMAPTTPVSGTILSCNLALFLDFRFVEAHHMKPQTAFRKPCFSADRTG
jgi:hypothetical protein